MKKQVSSVKMSEFFYDFDNECFSRGCAVPSVLLWEYDLLSAYWTSKEDFCEKASSYLGGIEKGSVTTVYLCAKTWGTGGTPRIRNYYGLWKTMDQSYPGLGVVEKREMRIDEGDDFFFVGEAELDGGITKEAMLALWNGGKATDFLYLRTGDSKIGGRELMGVLPAVYGDTGIPFFASFNLLPLFEAMPDGDAVICIQNYGDGLAAYLLRKTSA